MLGVGAAMSATHVKSWAPNDISDLALWLKNGKDVTAAQWKDQSGNGNDAGQTTADNRAVVTTPDFSIGGDAGSLNFEGGSDNYYDLGSKITISTNHNFLVAIVITIESYDSLNCVLSDGSNEFIEFQTNKKIRIKTLDGSATSSIVTQTAADFAAGSKMLITISRNDGSTGTFNVYKGKSEIADSWSNQANPKGIEFGNLGIRADSDRPFDGIIHEVLVYDFGTTTHTVGELTDLQTYLMMVHGL